MNFKQMKNHNINQIRHYFMNLSWAEVRSDEYYSGHDYLKINCTKNKVLHRKFSEWSKLI